MVERQFFPPLSALTLTPEQAALLSLMDQVGDLRRELQGLKQEIEALKSQK